MSTRGPLSSLTALVGACALIAAAGCGVAPTAQPGISVPDGPLVQQLRAAVRDDAAMTHLAALQKIADANGGNRSAGSPGYAASVEYVAGALRGAGFTATTPTYGHDGDPAATGRNVIAQTTTGDPGRVVVIGAHLDSVPEGPGIVDNGSGVATLLEIATRLGARPDVRNAVRFAFFGSEENDAEGSSGYVDSLSRDDRQKIELYLNVDMVASPNAGYIVQGGTGDDEESAGPPGSAAVGGVLAAELAKTGVATPEITEFVGDDESAFIDAGIPAGGAENGDAKEKTAGQARIWGGQAGEVYDRCYHQACDGIDNVNRDVLDHYLKAIAATVAHFATSTAELR
jgi:aminopeptidase S